MEGYILYILSLFFTIREPVRPCVVDVSNRANFAIKYRLFGSIVILEDCSVLYGYTELLFNNSHVIDVIVNGIW